MITLPYSNSHTYTSRQKLLTFCTNSRPRYFWAGNIIPQNLKCNSTPTWQKHWQPLGSHPTFLTGLYTELKCPTLSPGFLIISLGHPQRRHWMFFVSLTSHESFTQRISVHLQTQFIGSKNILLIYLSSKCTLDIHSGPFSPKPWSTCSNKQTFK